MPKAVGRNWKSALKREEVVALKVIAAEIESLKKAAANGEPDARTKLILLRHEHHLIQMRATVRMRRRKN